MPSAPTSDSMVIASAGHTASHSLQAMQRSSPFGYRRSACSPRKRTDCGVFSSGYCTVTLRRNSERAVTDSPASNSVSMNVLIGLAIAISGFPGAEVIPAHQGFHRDPHQGHRNEKLPAQAHDLVVAVAREGGAKPQEQEQQREYLDEQPQEARLSEEGGAQPRIALHRT